MPKSEKLTAQVAAIRENLKKSEEKLRAVEAKAKAAEEARIVAARDGKDAPAPDRRAVEEAKDAVEVLRSALERAEDEAAKALLDEEGDALRAEMKAVSKGITATEPEVVEALAAAMKGLSKLEALSERFDRIDRRLRKVGLAFTAPERIGYNLDRMVEMAGERAWKGVKTNVRRDLEVVLELHPDAV